ncbi:ribosomal protein S5 domain 2-type protein [Ochromonadaceae sp. CCMP2298]|nr:ribosomal protein S5 domain 2-type protein [Ochromonadaceae sp. CCMP2298]|mmetsp:Transcript_23582/g.52382  ORF Transcript_23582/g.52382 Transcript_23582/m.52382 type:complete len:301 (-) Transcript_23582:77-979(-)
MKAISAAERVYICEGCAVGIRYDGRGPESFRSISVENNVLPNVNGSSRVRIANAVDIICTVKLEVVELEAAGPRNLCEVSVEVSRSCNIHVDETQLNSYGTLLAERLQSMLAGSSCLDSNDFSIIKNKCSWMAHVDLLVLQMDGDPLDACSAAAFLALGCTRVPRTELVAGETGLLEDFDVLGDLALAKPISTQSVPISITVAKVGEVLLFDASGEEQQCASCVLSIAIDRSGKCCGLTYLRHGLLEPGEVTSCIDRACRAALATFEHLQKYTQAMDALETAPAHTRCPDEPALRLGLLV